jgi:hypothetical protein
VSAKDRALDRLQRATAEAWCLADAHPEFRKVASALDDALGELADKLQMDSQDWTDEAQDRLEKEGLL